MDAQSEEKENEMIRKFATSCSFPKGVAIAGIIVPPLLLVAFALGLARLFELKRHRTMLMSRESESHYTVYALNDLKDAQKALNVAVYLPVVMLVVLGATFLVATTLST